jgi:molybdenum cofactor cytidylyltransferase
VAVKAERSSFGVVVLAAGASRRMGESKLLLPWGGRTILGHLVNEWRSLEVGQVAVVIRAGDPKLQKELGRLGFVKGDWIENQQADEGMFRSIEAAAGWVGWRTWVTHYVIALADQPSLRNRAGRSAADSAGHVAGHYRVRGSKNYC